MIALLLEAGKIVTGMTSICVVDEKLEIIDQTSLAIMCKKYRTYG